MYNIYYSLADSGWESHDITSDANTVVKAFMDAVREMWSVLSTKELEFLPVGEMEFVVWGYGKCKAFLAITEIGPETSAQGLEGG